MHTNAKCREGRPLRPELHLARAVLAIAISASSVAAFAQGAAIHKAPPAVVERAKAGIPQELSVALEAGPIWARAEERRRAKGIGINDREIEDQLDSDFEEQKRAVFPGGRYAGATVIRNHPKVPIVVLRVSDLQTLDLLLRDPRVRSIEDDHRLFYPAR